MAVPTKDLLLMPYAQNYSDRITAQPTRYGYVAGQATALVALVDPYIVAAQAALNIGQRSRSLVSAKNSAKAALLPYLRELYGLCLANTTVSDADKDLLGVKVRAMPQPQPVPSVQPALDIISVTGNVVRVRTHDAAGEGKRSKPAGVKGAAIFSYVGPTAPNDPSLYKWEGSSNRSVVEVEFPIDLAPGTIVWLSAAWYNERQQNGTACQAVSTRIQYGMSQAA